MKNIVYIATSLDGYIAGEDGNLDWLHDVPNPTGDDLGFANFMDSVDCLLMGRVTYETVRGFGGEWPYPKKVFVLSNNLKKIPDELKDKVEIINGEIKDVLKKIHGSGHKNIYVDGGKTIQSLLSLDLIDELIISTIPILLGKGCRLFGELSKPLKFKLEDSKVLINYIVQSKFSRVRE